MNHRWLTHLVSLFIFLQSPGLSAAPPPPQIPLPPWAPRVETLTGLKGHFNEKEGIFKIKSPRTELVSVDGISLPPEMGLTSWASFTQGSGDRFMVLSHLVLLQDEVNPTLDAIIASGLSVTSLHHHFFFDEPRMFGLTFLGDGNLDKLARAFKSALLAVQTVRAKNAEEAGSFGGAPLTPKAIMNTKALTAILGNGKMEGGVFKAVFGRSARVPCNCLLFKGKPSQLGLELTKDMGVSTSASFFGGDDNAIVNGHFAVTEDELQHVLKSLRSSDINIVGIEQHTINETPRLSYIQYWGRGKADSLATAIKTALAETNAKKK
jgi:Domain of Unknown Function (DUF1259)